MAYNTNTKLLLNFNGSNGATTTTDTSQTPFAVTLANEAQISSTQGKFSSNSLRLGNPDGTRSVGTLALNSPAGALSTDRASAKVFDFWFWRNMYGPPWGSHPLISITFQNGDTLALWHGSTSIDIEVNGNNKDGSYTYANVAHYGSGSWDHYRLALYGDTLWCGLNGSEVFTATNSTSNDLWVGDATNPITQFRIGGYPTSWGADANAFAVGYIDCFQVLDGDTSWLGGTYTVPTAAPDDYAGGGGGVTVALTGQSFTHSQGTITDTVSGSVTAGLTGQSFSHAQGAFGKSRSRALSGQYFTHALGTITALKGVFPLLPGTTYTFAQGIPAVPRSKVLAGQAFAFAQGEITATSVFSRALTGQAYSHAQGNIGKTVTVGLTGQSFSHALGKINDVPGVGANTTNDVTSTGFGGDLTANNYALMTTLMLHGNSAGLLKDDSLYAKDAAGTNVSLSTTPPVMGDGAIQFAASVSSANGGEILPVLGQGLFFDMTSNKIFDFVLNLSAASYANVGVLGFSFAVTPYFPGSSSSINLIANTTTRKLTLSVVTPAVNTSVETAACFTLGSRVFLRLAFVGQNCYLCANGTQIATIASYTGGNIWPETTYPHAFKISSALNSLYGTLDEFRIQEGSSANTGYSGGNYTVSTSEWWPAAVTGAGANTTEAILGSGEGEISVVIEGVGANTLDGTTDEGNANVGIFREGVGDTVVGDVTSVGEATTLPLVYGIGTNTTEAVTSAADGFLWWAGRGANILEAITASGSGTVANGVSEGANTTEAVRSVGAGSVAIVGAGANTTETIGQGEGTTAAYGDGAATTGAITSTGAGYVDKSLVGANTTSVTSAGEGVVFTSGAGGSLAEHASTGSGTVLISGTGSNTTGVLTFFGRAPEANDDEFESFSLLRPADTKAYVRVHERY